MMNQRHYRDFCRITIYTFYATCFITVMKKVSKETVVLHQWAQGGTQSINDGRSDVFFWVENLHAHNFFGSRDLSRIF